MSNESDPPDGESAEESPSAGDPPPAEAADSSDETASPTDTTEENDEAASPGATAGEDEGAAASSPEDDEPSPGNADAADEGMTREEELEERARTLDERERGLKQIRSELDEREAELDNYEDRLGKKRENLQAREAELDEREQDLEERATSLDDREAAIETQEEKLAERAEQLDDHEEVLELYVDGRVGEALDGRIDRIEKVVGDRIVALEEEVAETVEREVSAAVSDREETSPLALASGIVLGLVGIVLVALGLVFVLADELASVPSLHPDFTINLVGAAVLILAGLAANLFAISGRISS